MPGKRRARLPVVPPKARALIKAWEDRGHLFDSMMAFLEAQDCGWATFYKWTKTHPKVKALHEEIKRDILHRRRLRKGMVMVAKLGDVKPPKPDVPLDKKRQAFLEHFAKNGDRIDAARASGMEWEDVEREMAEGGALADSFKKLERRLEIRLRDRLRLQVIENGNAAALNALVRHGLMPTPNAPEGGGGGGSDPHDEQDVARYGQRLGVLRASYDAGVVH